MKLIRYIKYVAMDLWDEHNAEIFTILTFLGIFCVFATIGVANSNSKPPELILWMSYIGCLILGLLALGILGFFVYVIYFLIMNTVKYLIRTWKNFPNE